MGMGIPRIKVGLIIGVAVLPLLVSLLYYAHNNKQSYSDNNKALKSRLLGQQEEAELLLQSDMAEEEEIFGVKIHRNPPQSKLTHLNVTSWPKWGCSPSKFPWEFKATETMYLLEGKVKVYCEGYDGSFEIGAGDLVVFPKGMKITWDVVEAVSKHYHLDK